MNPEKIRNPERKKGEKHAAMIESGKAHVLRELVSLLPKPVGTAYAALSKTMGQAVLSEIRLRAGRYQSFTAAGENLVIGRDGTFGRSVSDPLILSEKDLAETVFLLCGGSVYAHAAELRAGYIARAGVRIGVCGRHCTEDGLSGGFSEYASVNIRLPHHIRDAAAPLMGLFDRRGAEKVGGVLVVSPPGIGKTTFLRAAAARLSTGFYDGGRLRAARVCVVDEREELYLPDAFSGGFADILSAMPKARGIELCTRVMSPDYIVCDEIGSDAEAEAIRAAAPHGVTFLASCHGVGLRDVSARRGIGTLIDAGIFSTVCELSADKAGKSRFFRAISTSDGSVLC